MEDLWQQGHFIKSQSILGGSIYYDKKNVYATEVTRERYLVCPRAEQQRETGCVGGMWHYTVALTQELVRRVLWLRTRWVGLAPRLMRLFLKRLCQRHLLETRALLGDFLKHFITS